MRRAALALALVVAACGGGSLAVSEDGSAALVPRIAAVREAAERGDHETAREALADVLREVGALQESGDLSPERAVELRAAAGEVQEALALLPAPTTTTTQPPPPEDDKDDDDEDKDDDEGKGKGRDKDD